MTADLLHPSDLDPAHVAPRTYLTRRLGGRIDAASVIVVMLALLMLIPAQLIIPGTTDVGRPAIVICILMCCWWIIVRLSPGLTLVGPQPLRWGVAFLMLSTLASYTAGYLRGLTTMEANSADRWLLGTAGFIGVILMTADGIRNWSRLKLVLIGLVGCASIMALIGLLQSVLRFNFVPYLMIPGFETKGMSVGLEARGGGIRVASTTYHYIELSAILATVLPFALHLVLFAKTRRGRRWAIVAALLIAMCIPATISRTGIIAMGIGLVVLMPLWSWRFRYNLFVLGTGLLAVVAVVKSSFASTLVDIFVNMASDPSITSRTEDWDLVAYYFAQRPWLGRGAGTWVVPQYIFLDNQWLSTALCMGIVGIAALATLHILAITIAGIALKRATSTEDKHLCAALISCQLMAMFVAATFDSLWFSSYATVLSLTIGLCGTVWRFTHPERTVRTSTAGLRAV